MSITDKLDIEISNDIITKYINDSEDKLGDIQILMNYFTKRINNIMIDSYDISNINNMSNDELLNIINDNPQAKINKLEAHVNHILLLLKGYYLSLLSNLNV
jgi:hypothetical protein